MQCNGPTRAHRWVEDALKEDPDFFKKLKHGQVWLGCVCMYV